MVAFISPLGVPPTPLKAAATRDMYAGLGLLLTRCWINSLPTNGPTLGWLKILSIALSRSCCAVSPAAAVEPTGDVASNCFDPVSCSAAYGAMGPLLVM